MPATASARRPFAAWLLPLAALLGLGIALFDYFWTGNGIHGTGGALLVAWSSAVLLIAALILASVALSSWPHRLLLGVILVDVLGTGFAAYLLESWWLLAAMVLALVGWLVAIVSTSVAGRVPDRTLLAGTIALACVVAVVLAVGPWLRGDDDMSRRAVRPAPATAAAIAPASSSTRYTGWYTFNGDLMDQKYSDAGQITPANVTHLRKAWEVHTGDVSDGSGKLPVSDWSATPLFVNDTVYVGTPFYRIFALAPDTGRVKWIYDTQSELKAETQPNLKSRGVAYWRAETPEPGKACQKIVYLGTMDAKLHAVDADTGRPCEGFADHGVLNVNRWNTTNAKFPLSVLQPPTVFRDTLFIGWAGKDWAFSAAPPGNVLAVDARTGQLKWEFRSIPAGAVEQTGTANVWASMSVDPEHGILYVPVSSPSPNFYGGNLPPDLPLVTSVTALDVDTGRVVWSRKIVNHDIWDYDTNAPPTLVDLQRDGKTVPALVQTTKMGFLFVLSRLTGEPLFPIEERPVPASDVPGERAAPTQPYPVRPEPTVPDRLPGISTLADIASFGECSRTLSQLRYEARYTPPSVQGSLAFPSTAGGVEWGGGAVDPRSGIYVVNSSAVAQIYRLIPRNRYEQITRNGTPDGYYPQEGAPFGFYLHNFVNRWGMPCWKPPYGTMSAYDLNSGELLWRKPFGQVQKWGFYMPESWGSVTIGGPLITRSGLVFIGGSMDARVRAIDLASGRVLWTARVDAPAVANPGTYVYNGRQYVVFVSGGNAILKPQVSDQVVAYALPENAR